MVSPMTTKRLLLSIACVCGLLVSYDRVVAQQFDAVAASVGDQQEFDGRVVANEKVEFRNRTNQDLAIIWLIEEGTQVAEGDLLAQLDRSLIENNVAELEVVVRSGEAELRKAEMELYGANVSMETQRQELDARLALIESRKEMMFSKDGELAVKREVLESTIRIEEERINLLQVKLKDIQDDGREDSAILELRLQLVQSESALRVAKVKLSHLKEVREDYERKQLELEKELCAAEGKRNLTESELEIEKAKAEVDAQKGQLRMVQAELERSMDEARLCEIVATQAGVVFYYHQDSRFSDPLVIEEGEIIRPQQNILYLPNLDSLNVECQVPEAVIGQVKIGQEVSILVDGGDDLVGRVASVANWPSSPEWGGEGKTTYKVLVEISDPEQVKIGQNVQVKMKIE